MRPHRRHRCARHGRAPPRPAHRDRSPRTRRPPRGGVAVDVAVADQQRAFGRRTETAQRLDDDGRVGLGRADVARRDDDVEQRVDAGRREQLPYRLFVHDGRVGDRAEPVMGLERVQCVEHPGIRPCDELGDGRAGRGFLDERAADVEQDDVDAVRMAVMLPTHTVNSSATSASSTCDAERDRAVDVGRGRARTAPEERPVLDAGRRSAASRRAARRGRPRTTPPRLPRWATGAHARPIAPPRGWLARRADGARRRARR